MAEQAMIEEAAEIISDYVAWRRWENMAEDRADLRMKMREGDFDTNEPTKDDCREAARAVIDRLRATLTKGDTDNDDR